MKILPFSLILAGAIIDTIGDVVMKTWIVSGRKTVFIIGLLIYLVGLVFLAESYKGEKIPVASIIFVVLNVVILTLVSWLYFKESLNSLQIIGILLGITSVVVLELT